MKQPVKPVRKKQREEFHLHDLEFLTVDEVIAELSHLPKEARLECSYDGVYFYYSKEESDKDFNKRMDRYNVDLAKWNEYVNSDAHKKAQENQLKKKEAELADLKKKMAKLEQEIMKEST
jgi:YHS domain-containing protein